MIGIKKFTKKIYKKDKLAEVNKTYMESRANVIIGWKELHNNYSDSKAKTYENLCKENISQYYNWVEKEMKNKNYQLPTQVDAFKYLAMLYERQGRYKEAISICDEAISVGATYDNTKSGMEGRRNRLQKKILNNKI